MNVRNYNSQDIQVLGDLIEQISTVTDKEQSVSSVLSNKTLGAVATRVNVLATLHKLLCNVAEESSANEVIKMIQQHADVNCANSAKSTPLHIAAGHGHHKSVQSLIDCNAVVNVVDNSNSSPLHAAAAFGCESSSIHLLNYNASIDCQDDKGKSALHVAAGRGRTKVVKVLLERSANVDLQDFDGCTALHAAALSGVADTVHSVLEAKASVHAFDNFGRSVLDIAESDDSRFALKIRSVNQWTLLMVTAERGNKQVRAYLNLRSCLLSMQLYRGSENSTPEIGESEIADSSGRFPDWFQVETRTLSNLSSKKIAWTLKGPHEQDNLVFSDGDLCVCKERDYPDYSSLFGSEVFEPGIHLWRMKVQNVLSMWLGIGSAENPDKRDLGRYPGNAFSQLLAFHSDGAILQLGQDSSSVRDTSGRPYTSGQEIEFELNTYDCSLSMKIDDVCVTVVTGLTIDKTRPFICMDYNESVQILDQRSRTVSEWPFSDDDIDSGLNNDNWSKEADIALFKVIQSGARFYFDTDFPTQTI